MNQQDGWVNFSDYLALNKDASQRQLQAALDARKGDAESIRSNADKSYAAAGAAGFEGNPVDYGRGEQQQKLMMEYGNFVEGLSDPSRLEAYFAKNGAGGNNALDAGLASVAGAGQIQEAQKGLSALRNYVTERGVDTDERFKGGQEMRARADSQAEAERVRRQQQADYQRSLKPVDERARTNQANQSTLNATGKYGDNWGGAAGYAASTGDLRKEYDKEIAKADPFGKRFASSNSMTSFMPSWAKPKGF